MSNCCKIDFLENFPIYFLGPEKEKGPLPAFFYFALSGEESLTSDPFNQPALAVESGSIRVFSLDLPGHGPGWDKFKAMEFWAEKLWLGEDIITIFLTKAVQAIQFLIDEGYVDSNHIAVGGLSRGGFIATHLAAIFKKISLLLNFAPLTSLNVIEEFIIYSKDPLFEGKIEELNLKHLTSQLLHLKKMRFYIGNRDIRVSTDECYEFIKKTANDFHQARIRDCQIELFITQSIGHKGHGTSAQTFIEGAEWLKRSI